MVTPSIPLALFNNLFEGADILIIAFLGLLLFGNRLPSIGKSLGQTIVNFKKGLRETESEIEKASTDGTPPEQTPAAQKRITASNPYRQNIAESTTPAARKSKMISQSSEEV